MFVATFFVLATVASGGITCSSESPCSVNGHDVYLAEKRESTGVLPLTLTSRDVSRWPADAKVIVSAGERRWTIEVSRRELAKSTRLLLHAPDGEYETTIEVPRHRKWRQRLHAATDAKVFTARLEPLPSVAGRVVTREGSEPVAGVPIEVDEKVVAVSDGSGAFAFDADPDKWPESVTVHAGGYAVAVVAIPPSRTSASLLDIELAKGGNVAVSIERPETVRDLRVDLIKRKLARPEAKPLQSKQLAAGVKRVRFDDVEAGDYVVVVSGSSSEHIGKPISVTNGETTNVGISLRPMNLTLRAELAGEPLRGATVHLHNLDGLWEDDVELREDGLAKLNVWQLGRFSAVVTDEPTLTSPFFEKRDIADADEAEWNIHVSTRELTGSVIDAASGKPIPNGNVALRSGSAVVVSHANASGHFRFTAITPGRHTLMAAADGYSPREIRYTYEEGIEKYEKNIELDPAGERRVFVRDSNGAPLAGAAVLNFAGLTLAGQRFTEETGYVSIPIRDGDVQDIFVIPRDGSFAVATLREGNITVTIPEARSTIVIRSETSAHEAIPDVWLVMRYNGIALPFEVQQMLARMQGTVPVSGPDGRIVLRQMPSGYYEFWPVGSAGEMRALMTGLGADAPVKLTARPGVNNATLTFEKPRTPAP